MKDLSDNEFDRLFKEKSQNFDYDFEEEAWLLMEKKLRKKDRIIFFRNLSIAAGLLLFMAIGLYLFNSSKQSKQIAKKASSKDSIGLAVTTGRGVNDSISNSISRSAEHTISNGEQVLTAKLKARKKAVHHAPGNSKRLVQNTNLYQLPITSKTTEEYPLAATDQSAFNSVPLLGISGDQDLTYQDLPSAALNANSLTKSTERKPEVKTSSGPRYSLTFSAGPDFSSTRSVAGKRGNLNVGVLLNVNFNHFTLSTGARYGVKKYDAEALDYALKNPSRASQIYNIDASCNVLEIPVQFSVPLKSWGNKGIDINTGLSSYLMLKEKYLFEYTPESGVNDFLLTKNNANQSYFGVVSLSANYKFRPTNQNIRFGIQPYVKLPLGGVGEGKVKLKSSGVSLTMTYGTIKKR